jgi:hypothetical protein
VVEKESIVMFGEAMRSAIGVSIGIAAMLLVAAPRVDAQTLNRTASKDAETLMIVHVNAYKERAGMLNCSQGGTVVLEITRQPANGTLATKPTKTKDKDCTNELTGTGLYYTPKPGFTGKDSFSYVRTDQNMREVSKAGGPQGARTINVEVK